MNARTPTWGPVDQLPADQREALLHAEGGAGWRLWAEPAGAWGASSMGNAAAAMASTAIPAIQACCW